MLKKLALAALLLTVTANAQQPVKRARILGISHVAYFVSDLPKALAFWHDLLGYEVYFTKTNASGAVLVDYLKINDRQHVELFTDPPTIPHNQMSHLCFTVDDVQQMRAYLRTQGFNVANGKGGFRVSDPDGTVIEFVQDGGEEQAIGRALQVSRISDTIYHVGFIVRDAARAMDFYGRTLGFHETWRGTPPTNPDLSWINMQVPDGVDYVEFMLYRAPNDPKTWGGKNHVALSVPNIHAALARLQANPAAKNYTRSMEVKTGTNQKRQLNLFDPDGTRVELMEPVTITGKPTPPSTAPPPPSDYK